jgi:ribosomal protein S15P/S13E
MTLPTLTPDERATLAAPVLTLSQYAARLRQHAADHPDDHERAIGLAVTAETLGQRIALGCARLGVGMPT